MVHVEINVRQTVNGEITHQFTADVHDLYSDGHFFVCKHKGRLSLYRRGTRVSERVFVSCDKKAHDNGIRPLSSAKSRVTPLFLYHSQVTHEPNQQRTCASVNGQSKVIVSRSPHAYAFMCAVFPRAAHQ